METEKHTVPIGKEQVLVFEADTANADEQEMGRLVDIVAATKPKSIQEFFIRLAAMQKSAPVSGTDGL